MESRIIEVRGPEAIRFQIRVHQGGRGPDLLFLHGAGGLLQDDPFLAALPFELPGLLFHDPERHAALLSAGGDLNDPQFLTDFLIGNARRLGMAGKLMFPIPDRGLAKRLHRIRARTAVIWGNSDRLIDPVYVDEFVHRIPGWTLHRIDAAGHMPQYEQPDAVVRAIAALCN